MRTTSPMRGFLLLLLSVQPHAQREPVGGLAPAPRQLLLFDADWRFHRGGAQSAEQPAFDDASWRTIDLPHDWSIEDLPGTSSPSSRDAIGQVSAGFTIGGTGWYRKRFVVPEADRNKRILFQFDGAYMNPEVWINGASLGSHPYGYTSFWFDLTDHVVFGAPKVLAVKVSNEGENSRWYSGSGIYRPVWMKVVEPMHVAQWGTGVTTEAFRRWMDVLDHPWLLGDIRLKVSSAGCPSSHVTIRAGTGG